TPVARPRAKRTVLTIGLVSAGLVGAALIYTASRALPKPSGGEPSGSSGSTAGAGTTVVPPAASAAPPSPSASASASASTSASPAAPALPPGACPEPMVGIDPKGPVWIGSKEGEGESDERPRHQVTLKPYCMDRTEVTVAAYAKCVSNKKCAPAGTG